MPHVHPVVSARPARPAPVAPSVADVPRRIGLVGGPTRAAQLLERTARDHGFRLEHHTGDTAGRGAPTLEALVRRVDLVVILTDLNSHNGVVACRRLAVAHGRPHVLLRRCGPARLADLLADLAAGRPLADAGGRASTVSP